MSLRRDLPLRASTLAVWTHLNLWLHNALSLASDCLVHVDFHLTALPLALIYDYLEDAVHSYPGEVYRHAWWPLPPWDYPILPSLCDPYWASIDKIFIHVPKTAGCSIRWSTLGKYRVGYFGHMQARQFPPSLWPKMVAVVRNPYDRAVSAYFFNKEGGFGLTPEFSQKLNTTYNGFNKWVLGALDGNRESIADVPQVEWCRTDLDLYGIYWNHVQLARYETLDADIKEMLDIAELPKINSTTRKHWSTYYQCNPQIKETIDRVYAADFLELGYKQTI